MTQTWTTGELAPHIGQTLQTVGGWSRTTLPHQAVVAGWNTPRQLTFADCLALAVVSALVRAGTRPLAAQIAVRNAVLKGDFGRIAADLAQDGDALLAEGGPLDTVAPCFVATIQHAERGAEDEATGSGEIATAASLHRFVAPGGAFATVPLAPLLRRLQAGLPHKAPA